MRINTLRAQFDHYRKKQSGTKVIGSGSGKFEMSPCRILRESPTYFSYT